MFIGFITQLVEEGSGRLPTLLPSTRPPAAGKRTRPLSLGSGEWRKWLKQPALDGSFSLSSQDGLGLGSGDMHDLLEWSAGELLCEPTSPLNQVGHMRQAINEIGDFLPSITESSTLASYDLLGSGGASLGSLDFLANEIEPFLSQRLEQRHQQHRQRTSDLSNTPPRMTAPEPITSGFGGRERRRPGTARRPSLQQQRSSGPTLEMFPSGGRTIVIQQQGSGVPQRARTPPHVAALQHRAEQLSTQIAALRQATAQTSSRPGFPELAQAGFTQQHQQQDNLMGAPSSSGGWGSEASNAVPLEAEVPIERCLSSPVQMVSNLAGAPLNDRSAAQQAQQARTGGPTLEARQSGQSSTAGDARMPQIPQPVAAIRLEADEKLHSSDASSGSPAKAKEAGTAGKAAAAENKDPDAGLALLDARALRMEKNRRSAAASRQKLLNKISNLEERRSSLQALKELQMRNLTPPAEAPQGEGSGPSSMMTRSKMGRHQRNISM
ncbi:hypothetical protein WJX72_005608 [[Myrmecia] bisecta]|uniref:BZIP domain-containing protein n=1 Tax=[Myrmecia] bisecta TaxID=41462 RepID=A0AAW1PHA1_9CHLO